MEKVKLTLPEICFLDGWGAKGDTLQDRTVLLHVRSASVIEIFESDKCFLKDGVLRYNFIFENKFGVVEHFTAAVHYVMANAEDYDVEIAKDILKDCAEFYVEYCGWEDENIIESEQSKLN